MSVFDNPLGVKCIPGVECSIILGYKNLSNNGVARCVALDLSGAELPEDLP